MLRITLERLDDIESRQTFLITSPRRIRIGRDPGAEVPLDPASTNHVSRRHATIICAPGATPRCVLVDMQSRGGTYVNRRRVTRSQFLAAGDRIQLGPGGPEFRFGCDHDAASI